MAMDGPTGTGGPKAGQQVQQTDDLDDQINASETAKSSAFSRSVVKLKDTPPLLKTFDDDPEASRPKQTPLGERRARFEAGKLSTNPTLSVPADFPVRSTANRLNAREASFQAPDGASYENKKALQEAKNTYLSAGLSVLQEVQETLDAAQHRAEWLDPPDEGAIQTINEQRRTLKGLERGFRSNIDDPRIMSIKTPAGMMAQFEKMQTYPENLMSRLAAISGMNQEELQGAFDLRVTELDRHRVDIRNAQLPVSSEKKSESNHTYRDLYDHQELMFTSAIKVARQGASNALASGNAKQQKKLAALADQLSHQLGAIKQSVALKEGDKPVSKQDKKAAKKLPTTLKKLLAKSGLDKKAVFEAFHRVQVHELNRKGWESFKGEFTDPMNLHCKMSSEQVPACDMGKIFTTPYEKGAGVSCVDTENTAHANNLWKSRFVIRGKAVFNGIRHGIVDAAGVASSALRGRAAEKKAEEVLVAALASKPELFEQAMAAAKPAKPGKLGDPGKPGSAMPPPRLLLTSTSLVTTGKGSSKERKMQEQQNKAFKTLIKKAKGNVLVLDVPAPNGKTRKVKFELKMSRFNIPVNYGGVGALQKVTSGRLLQRSMNKPAMAELVGKGRDIGGDTAFHLRHLDWQVKQKNQQKTELAAYQKPTPAVLEQQRQLDREIGQLKQEMKIVNDLAHQVKDIYRRGAHHSEGHDTYKLAARVAYLTHLIGGVPLYNCKSGKDRTGMLDAEIKLLAAQIERDGEVPAPGRLSYTDQALFRTILLNTGNHEVQKTNVGVQGYKTEMIDSITERVGNDDVRQEVRGLSEVTSK